METWTEEEKAKYLQDRCTHVYLNFASRAVLMMKSTILVFNYFAARGAEISSSSLSDSEKGIENANLSNYIKLQVEMALCDAVNNFLSFLSEIMHVILIKNPRIMSNDNDKISFRAVFDHTDIVSLQTKVIADKIEHISRKGFNELTIFFKENLKFEIHLNNENEKKIVKRIIDIRNLLIHNRGVMDQHYVDTYKSEDLKAGQPVPFGVSSMLLAVALLFQLMIRVMKDIRTRWKLNLIPELEQDTLLSDTLTEFSKWIDTYFPADRLQGESKKA